MPKFPPREVAQMEPRLRGWAVKLIEEVADKGECDFVRDIASRFPVSVFMELMGLPLEKLREFRALADSFFIAHTNEEIGALAGSIRSIFTECWIFASKTRRTTCSPTCSLSGSKGDR